MLAIRKCLVTFSPYKKLFQLNFLCLHKLRSQTMLSFESLRIASSKQLHLQEYKCYEDPSTCSVKCFCVLKSLLQASDRSVEADVLGGTWGG